MPGAGATGTIASSRRASPEASRSRSDRSGNSTWTRAWDRSPWTTTGSTTGRAGFQGPGGLWTVRLDGLDNEQLTTDVAGTGPVLDSGALYYFDTGGDPDVGFWSALRTIPASGGNVTDVRRETNTMIWPGPLSLGAGSVFTVTQSGFWRAPLDGSKWQVTWGGSDIARSDVNGGM